MKKPFERGTYTSDVCWLKSRWITAFFRVKVQCNELPSNGWLASMGRATTSSAQYCPLFLDRWMLARAVARSAFMSGRPSLCWASVYPSLPPQLFSPWTHRGLADGRGSLRSAGSVTLSTWLFTSFVGWMISAGCHHVIQKPSHFEASDSSTHMHLP